MKNTAIIALLLTYNSSAAPHSFDKRQPQGASGHGHSEGKPAGGLANMSGLIQGMSGVGATPKKSYRVVKAQPTVPRAGVERLQIWYGPYKIRGMSSKEKTEAGYSMDPAGTGWNVVADDFPKDVTVLRGYSKVVYADGTRATIQNGLYNHHLIMTNLKKKTPTMSSCPGRPVFNNPISLFVGGAEDASQSFYTTQDGKFNSGYYIGKEDPIISSGDLVNYTNDTKIVYSMTDVEFVRGKVPDHYEVSTQVLSVGMCDGLEAFAKPKIDGPKKFKLTSKDDSVVTNDGFIVNSIGHLHDGGVEVILTINGKQICRSEAIYGGTIASMTLESGKKWETINNMTRCEGPFEIKKGDKIHLEASYDLEKHPPRAQHDGGMAETMALQGIIFASKAT